MNEYYENKPKLSLIIPTRNGSNYVWAPIETILSQDYSEMELLVSVNHSSDDTLVRLQQYQDPRLKVVVPPRLLSMAGHYEWCLKQVTGEWVSIIGDDDGVMPYFFNEFEFLLKRWEKSNIDAFCFRRAYYFWPGCEAVYGNSVISYGGIKKEKTINGKENLWKALIGLNGHFDLPQLYTNNIIRRSLVENIRNLSMGNFYHEINPDVYSGVAISLKARKIVRSEIPLFWTGTSPKSTAMQKSIILSDSAIIDSGTEFFQTSENENIGVSPLIGLAPWKILKSSSLWVASSLLKIPFRFEKNLNKKKLVLTVAVVSSWFLSNQCKLKLKKKLLLEIINRNNLSFVVIIFLFFKLMVLFYLSFLTGLFKKIIYRMCIDKDLILPNVRINNREGYYDLLDAHKKIKKLYTQR